MRQRRLPFVCSAPLTVDPAGVIRFVEKPTVLGGMLSWKGNDAERCRSIFDFDFLRSPINDTDRPGRLQHIRISGGASPKLM